MRAFKSFAILPLMYSCTPSCISALAMTRSMTRGFSVMKNPNAPKFFGGTALKAVVGASTDKSKFGNKVLRCYIEKKYPVVPINKRTPVVEEIASCESLDMLKTKIENGTYQGVESMGQVGLSVITPPAVTKEILEDAYNLGIRNFFLQPGTYDDRIDGLLQSGMKDALIIKGCVLVELAS